MSLLPDRKTNSQHDRSDGQFRSNLVCFVEWSAALRGLRRSWTRLSTVPDAVEEHLRADRNMATKARSGASFPEDLTAVTALPRQWLEAEISLLVNGADRTAVPDIGQVPLLAAVRQNPGLEDGRAFTAQFADAVISKARGAAVPNLNCKGLRRSIAVRFIDPWQDTLHSPDVVQHRIEINGVHPHIELNPGLASCPQKGLPVVLGFGNRRVESPARVEHAEAAIGEATAVRRQVRECRHDRAGAGAADPVFRRDKVESAHLVPQSVIGHALDVEDCFEIGRISGPLEQVDRREAARDDPVAWQPT